MGPKLRRTGNNQVEEFNWIKLILIALLDFRTLINLNFPYRSRAKLMRTNYGLHISNKQKKIAFNTYRNIRVTSDIPMCLAKM